MFDSRPLSNVNTTKLLRLDFCCFIDTHASAYHLNFLGRSRFFIKTVLKGIESGSSNSFAVVQQTSQTISIATRWRISVSWSSVDYPNSIIDISVTHYHREGSYESMRSKIFLELEVTRDCLFVSLFSGELECAFCPSSDFARLDRISVFGSRSLRFLRNYREPSNYI